MEGGSGSNDPGGSRSMFPSCGLVHLQELPDFSILQPQTLKIAYCLLEKSILKILDLQKYFSSSCDTKNNIKKTSKNVKMVTLFSFLKMISF